jgi:hypothetical protein
MFLKQQRNSFFEILQANGIPSNIVKEGISNESYIISCSEVPNTFFRATPFAHGGYWIIARPGIKGRPEKSEHHAEDWRGLLSDFRFWGRLLKEELDTPDLWAEAAKTAQLFATTTTPSDDKFTRAELAEVQGQLRQLQQSFTTAALPEAARQKLIELTQTAAVKAEGLTKKDWQNWIIGGFISAITALSLNPTQAADVLKLVKAAFGGLFLH